MRGVVLAIACMVGISAGAWGLDLEVVRLDLDVPQAGVESGESLSLEATIGVVDPEALTLDVRVDVSLRRVDKPEPCVTDVAILPPSAFTGGETSVSFDIDTSGLSGGDYEVIVAVDRGRQHPETDETNNQLSTTFFLQAPRPELHPTGFRTTPASPMHWGETASTETSVENSGGIASGAFHVELLVEIGRASCRERV